MLRLEVLASEEVEAIHSATLRILREVGVVLTQPQARDILAGAGAVVCAQRVLFPPDLVEQKLSCCPGRVSLRGRDPQEVAVLGDGTLHWHNLGGAPEVYDARNAQRRPATLQDVRDSARLLDALDNITTITPFFTPQDVVGPLMSLAMYRNTLPYTTKPLHGAGVQTAVEVRFTARMAAVIGPVAEVLTLGVSPISPLTLPDDVAEAIIEAARLGVPPAPLPCPIGGATAPLSLAGALAQQNAEVLATIVLAQLVCPGLPIAYDGRLAMMEPRSGLSVWSGVELGLVSAATVQIGHRYGLPVNVYGLSTNAHGLEIQNGYERALNAVIPALAGADELSGIGELEAGVLGSYAQMVCDNEIAASVRRLRRGFLADDDALAVEVIASAMDGSRNFLDQRHTARYLRAGEMLITSLAERRGWADWEHTGRAGMAERAQVEAERLLTEHEVQPLAVDQERELDEIMREAERVLLTR